MSPGSFDLSAFGSCPRPAARDQGAREPEAGRPGVLAGTSDTHGPDDRRPTDGGTNAPTVNDPTVNDPTVNDPTVNDPTTNDLTANDPGETAPSTNTPTANERRANLRKPGTRHMPAWPLSADLIRVESSESATNPNGGLDDVLAALAQLQERATASGRRYAGFISYDLGRLFESVAGRAEDDLGLPLLAFAALTPASGLALPASAMASPSWASSSLVSSSLASSFIEPSYAWRSTYTASPRPSYASAAPRPRPTLPAAPGPDAIHHRQAAQSDFARPTRAALLARTFDRAAYAAAVRRALDYIAAGDIFQVNLAQRFTLGTCDRPADVYRRLQAQHPAAYAAYMDFGDFQLLSNSPELFLRVERLPDGRRRVINRPIKGTRPTGDGMEAALRGSAKDAAELAMIVDLQRNDLGRVCQTGSVRVTEPRRIEAHPTLYHGVATVEGILRPDVGLAELISATFPCGSITGCPKIRSMQIIDELEPVRRGPYCGAIGWVGPDGTIELSVAIRTIVWQGELAHVSVGGGIVAESDPAAEYDETLVKAKAMFEALGVRDVR